MDHCSTGVLLCHITLRMYVHRHDRLAMGSLRTPVRLNVPREAVDL
jgi:hypothetical protein